MSEPSAELWVDALWNLRFVPSFRFVTTLRVERDTMLPGRSGPVIILSSFSFHAPSPR